MAGRVEHARWRVDGLDSRHLRHDALLSALDRAFADTRGVARSVAGHSAEGRPIQRLEVGRGDTVVLAWSQMHGNEPSGTMALVDLLAFLADATDPVAARITEAVRLVALPMLNPDGAERFERRNAQGIDLNRDALALASAELRVIAREFESVAPAFALSLHDQEPRKRVGSSRRLAAYSLAAPLPDARAGATGRDAQDRAKRIFAEVRSTLSPVVDDRLTRYQAPHEPRALCDNFQSRGTCTLLFEAGAWEGDGDKQYLRMVHFTALVAALDSIASRSYESAHPDDYGALPENGDDPLADLIVRGATLCVPGRAPYHADLAVRYDFPLEQSGAKIQDVGDLAELDGARELDATGLFVHAGAKSLKDGVPAQQCPAHLVARSGPHADDPIVWHIDEGAVTFSAWSSDPRDASAATRD